MQMQLYSECDKKQEMRTMLSVILIFSVKPGFSATSGYKSLVYSSSRTLAQSVLDFNIY